MDEMMGDEDIINLQNKKAIVVGSVGSGKASFCRCVTGLYGKTDPRMSSISVTKGVISYKGKYLRVTNGNNSESFYDDTKLQFTMTDTEEYGADDFSSDDLKNQLLDTLKFGTELKS